MKPGMTAENRNPPKPPAQPGQPEPGDVDPD